MRRQLDHLSSLFVGLLTATAVSILAFLIVFIFLESLPAFREIGVLAFLTGTKWYPVTFGGEPSYGILPMLLTTLYVSVIAVALALAVGVGMALYLSCVAGNRQRALLGPLLDLLAGIPSVVYGFVGLMVIVKFFEKLGRSAGESILAGGILLSVMILPYMVSACGETMLNLRREYEQASTALGVSKWYMAAQLILPASGRSILVSMILATGRAMGETMAVMMVIGNAPRLPSLLGKGETIASLIALEMGMAEFGSVHYHALYAAGFVLMVVLCIINAVFSGIKNRILR